MTGSGRAQPEPAWLHIHSHEPNPTPPPGDGAFLLIDATAQPARTVVVDAPALGSLPRVEVAGCFIVSTGHGTSGPFRFGGVRLLELVAWALGPNAPFGCVDLESADGFGTRLTHAALHAAPPNRPALLADTLNGAPLLRAQGLVRLIVPTETNDALQQVKWLARVTIQR